MEQAQMKGILDIFIGKNSMIYPKLVFRTTMIKTWKRNLLFFFYWIKKLYSFYKFS